MPVLNEQTRAYIYRIALAAFALAVVYGIVKRDDVDVWVELIGAVIGIGGFGLASKNTSTDPNRPKTVSEVNRINDLGRDRGIITQTTIWWIVGILLVIILVWFIFTNVIDIEDDEDPAGLISYALARWS